jgi:predicted TIM-barrel fold metal-dependent hydrolase
MIIDVHTHLNNYHEEKIVSIQECLRNLEEEMETNGVDYSLVLTSYKVNDHRPGLKQVIDITRDHNNIDVVAAISYLNYKEKDLREISDYLKDGHVKGLKLYPGYEPFYPHDKRMQVVYDLAMEFDVPVMFHSGDTYSPSGKVRFSHPIHIDDVAVDNPNLKIVICHVGNPWIKDCMEVVYKNKNCWADISGLVMGNFTDHFEEFMKNELREMILYAGEPKYLLFGTDWPICSMKSYINFVRQLDIPEEKKEMIFWKNAAQLFKIPVENLKAEKLTNAKA